MSVRNNRSEHIDRPVPDRDLERELGHDDPQPPPGDELLPPLAEFVQHPPPRAGRKRGKTHPGTQQRRNGIARRIRHQAPAGPGQPVRTPPSAEPLISERLWPTRFTAIACGNTRAGTVCGSSPCAA